MPDQLSLFAAPLRAPAVADLAGLLAGPGQAVRRGERARLSVIVPDRWRVAALLDEIAARGLAGSQAAAGDEVVVGTEFAAAVVPVAGQWLRGAVKRPPAGFVADGPTLRLWAIAAGRRVPAGFLLRLGPADQTAWAPLGTALAAAGLPATFVGVRADGPAWRITGRRRLARLAELVGDPPADTADWPGV